MAELNGNQVASWRLVLFGVIFVLSALVIVLGSIPILYELDSEVAAAAAKYCPIDTFFPGRLYAHFDSWIAGIIPVALLFLFANAITRPPLFPKGFHNRWGMPWTRRSIYILCASIAGAGLALWFTDATVFCVADSGIYRQAFPSGTFHKHEWKEVSQITVDCGYGRHGTDVSYILTMSDGSKLDVADAWPMPGPVWPDSSGYDQFHEKLKGAQFLFDAKIRPNCPKHLVDWIGQRP